MLRTLFLCFVVIVVALLVVDWNHVPSYGEDQVACMQLSDNKGVVEDCMLGKGWRVEENVDELNEQQSSLPLDFEPERENYGDS